MCKKVILKNSHQFFKHCLKLNVTKCCCYFQREPLYKRHPISNKVFKKKTYLILVLVLGIILRVIIGGGIKDIIRMKSLFIPTADRHLLSLQRHFIIMLLFLNISLIIVHVDHCC